VGSAVVNERRRAVGLIVAFAAGGSLASLVWILGAVLRAKDGDPPNPVRADLVEAASPPPTMEMTCPPPPACPSELATPGTTRHEHEHEEREHDPIGVDQSANVQAQLSAAMTEAKVRASFDLDCAARPCLALFAGEIPSEEERATVIQRLVDSQPGIKLTSTTIISEDGQVFWVLGLADEELTSEERALVDARLEDLLP
jgi:hypothetical protein